MIDNAKIKWRFIKMFRPIIRINGRIIFFFRRNISAKRVNELRKQTPTLTEEQAQQIAIDELLNKIIKEKEKK